MKSILYIALAALTALHSTSITAAPTRAGAAAPEAATEKTSISHDALLKLDGILGSNTYRRGCTVEESCVRDTDKRAMDALQAAPANAYEVTVPAHESLPKLTLASSL